MALAYSASKELRLGVLKEINAGRESDGVWAVAAEYFHNQQCWFKGRVTNQGVLSLFNRYILNKNWTFESFVESGLNPKHRVNGIAGTNLFAGLKIIYNE